MPLASIVIVFALSALAAPDYTPEVHLATISRRLKEVSAKVKEVEEAGAAAAQVGTVLGKYIGEDRKNQAALSIYLRKAKGADALTALKTVRAAGMWQAYLASAVLGLDGDAESVELRGFLEKRLTHLLATTAKVG